jgi:nucleotide-binding universal stress UspA family protein
MNTEAQTSQRAPSRSGPSSPRLYPPDELAEKSPNGAAFCIRQILVPIDFSEYSDLALKYAIPFAERFSAAITLLHVVEPPVACPETGAMYPSAELLEQLSQAEKERLAHVCEQQQLRVPLLRQALVQVGVPHEVINASAREQSIDLIILGTHGRTGLAHMLHGSIAERVLREAPCPVLVLRTERRDSTHNRERLIRNAIKYQDLPRRQVLR